MPPAAAALLLALLLAAAPPPAAGASASASPGGTPSGTPTRSPAPSASSPLSLTINGAPGVAGGSYPTTSTTVIATGATTITLSGAQLTSVVVNGSELVVGITESSGYVLIPGANNPTWDAFRVVERTPALVHLAWLDTNGAPLTQELHYLARAGVAGLYAYLVVGLSPASPNGTVLDVAVWNTRWNRCKLFRAVTAERVGSPPHGAVLGVSAGVQDSTWRVDGAPHPELPCPDTNVGDLPPGVSAGDGPYAYPYVYTKYAYSMYRAETPMAGHVGYDPAANASVAVMLTALSGVTGRTSAASAGGGPLSQTLVVHHDAVIVNTLHHSHYGAVGEEWRAPGASRLLGPWLTFWVTRPGPLAAGGAQEALLRDAAGVASREIAASLPGLPWLNDPRYPPPAARVTVVGRVVVTTDSRPPDALTVLLSTQSTGAGGAPVTDTTYALGAPTYWVPTAPDGSFSLPGVPPGVYSLYVSPRGGAMTGLGRWDGLNVSRASAKHTGGGVVDVGAVPYAPDSVPTFLWALGATDEEGGEFALGNHTREWDLPEAVPGSLTFTIGADWEPADWFYAQTRGGTWTVEFTLSRAYAGTAVLTACASMTDYKSPNADVNGVVVADFLPSGSDSTISRQAVRSGYPRRAAIAFPASLLRVGRNTVSMYRQCCSLGNNTGMGWDALLLEVDEGPAAAAPALPALGAAGSGYALPAAAGGDASGASSVWDISFTNAAGAAGPARLLRIEAVSLVTATTTTPVHVWGRDPARFAVPVVEELPPGRSAGYTLRITPPAWAPCPPAANGTATTQQQQQQQQLVVRYSANGRRVVGSLALPYACGAPSPSPTPPPSSSATLSPTATRSVLPPGVEAFCPSAALARVGGTEVCMGALALPASPAEARTWAAGQARCAALAPGGRLAHLSSDAVAAFAVGTMCGLGSGSTAYVGIALADPGGRACYNGSSTAWVQGAPVLAPQPGADGAPVVVDYAYTPAEYVRANPALWYPNQPDCRSQGTAHVGALYHPLGSAPRGLDDTIWPGGFTHACCEAALVWAVSRSASPAATPPPSPSATGSPPPSGTATGTPSAAPTRSGSGTGSRTPTGTPSPSGSSSAGATRSATATPSPSASASAAGTPTRSGTPTPTASPTGTPTRSGTPTASPTGTPTPSGSRSGSGTPSPSGSLPPSASGTPPPSASGTPPPSASGTPPPIPTTTGSATPPPTPTGTPSLSATGTRTKTAPLSPSGSRRPSPTPSPTRSRSRGTRSASGSRSGTPSRTKKPK